MERINLEVIIREIEFALEHKDGDIVEIPDRYLEAALKILKEKSNDK